MGTGFMGNLTKVFFLSAFLIFPSLCFAQDPPDEGCSFNFSKFKSPLDSKSKKLKNIEGEKKYTTEKILSQVAYLKTGEKVVFTGGGCAHFAYSFTYSKLKFESNRPEVYFQKAIELLGKTPVTNESKNILIAALKETQKTKIQENPERNYKLVCGDSNCSLNSNGKDSLQISYDFAL